MTNILILVISLLVLVIGFLIVRGVFRKSTPSSTVEGPLSLSSSTPLGKPADLQNAFLRTGSSSIQAFVYLVPYQRTGETTLCSSGNGADPSCGSDKYGTCVCNGTDCANCRHKGFADLLNISQVIRLEVLYVPDAGRPQSAYAQIVARTVRKAENTELDTADKRTEETFALPAIPFQKWTMITIAREGRRIDVYYNDEIVLSKRTESMLDLSALQAPLQSGSTKLSGKVGKVRFFDRRLNLSEVKTSYKEMANTRGEPYFSVTGFGNVFSNLTLCPNGDCLSGLSVNPPSGLVEWSSSYS